MFIRYASRSFSEETFDDVAAGLQFFLHDLTRQFRHCVVTAGEHIHGGITALGPGVDGDVRFGQQGQSSDALGFESVGDQVEKGRTSTFRCSCDGGSHESFVVEPDWIAVVQLKDAVFANHIGGLVVGVPPSRVGMQVRQGLLHQGIKEKQHATLSDFDSTSQVTWVKNLGLTTPAPFEALQVRGTDQALVVLANGVQKQLLAGGVQLGQNIVQKEKWRFPEQLGHQLQFRQLQAQHQGTLLTG